MVQNTKSSHMMQVVRGSLVTPLYGELSDERMLAIQANVLQQISDSGVKGLILDLNGIATIDSFLAKSIIETAKMASLLGATTVLSGLRAEIVVSLINLEIELHGIQTALNLDLAHKFLNPFVETLIYHEEDLEASSEDDENLEILGDSEGEEDNVEYFAEDL